MRRFSPTPTHLIIVLAVVARLAAIIWLQSYNVPRSTYEHGEIAENLLAGRGFTIRYLHVEGPTSMQAPAYPVLVAGGFALGGGDTPTSRLIIQIAQALLGGLLAYTVIVLARHLAPGRHRLALLAGLIAALYPTLVYAATHVQVALLAATLLTGSLALAFRASRTGRWSDALAAGLTLGLLVLTDPILGLVAPGMAWALLLGLGPRRALGRAAGLAMAAVVVVAPWVVRNAVVHGEFVPVKSTFGYAFWQGNCHLSHGTDKVVRASVEGILADPAGFSSLAAWNRSLWKARHEAGYIDDIALTPADYAALATLTEPQRSRWLLSRALDELRQQPGRYASLCLDRLRTFVFFDETNPKTRSTVYRASHLALTGLAAWGLLTLRRNLRRPIAPTILAVLLIGAFHVLTIVSARFHIPIEPLMGLWAAAGLDRSLAALTGRLKPRSWTVSKNDGSGRRDQPRRLTTSNASGS